MAGATSISTVASGRLLQQQHIQFFSPADLLAMVSSTGENPTLVGIPEQLDIRAIGPVRSPWRFRKNSMAEFTFIAPMLSVSTNSS